MFHHNTYIATIFLESMWFVSGDSQAVTSLPHFNFDSDNYTNNHAQFLHQITATKLTGKDT